MGVLRLADGGDFLTMLNLDKIDLATTSTRRHRPAGEGQLCAHSLEPLEESVVKVLQGQRTAVLSKPALSIFFP